MSHTKVAVLFVCLGNICRSPAAEGILRHLAKEQGIQDLQVKSCGLGSWYLGSLPDSRMQDAILRRGIVLSSRAQQFQRDFFSEFDYILAVDQEVLAVLNQHATAKDKEKLSLITEFSTRYHHQEIPDPFYGNDAGFELVLDMLEDSCHGFLAHLKNRPS